MKKLFCLFLALALLVSLVPTALAEDIVIVDPEAEDGPITVIDPEAAAQPEATLPVGELEAADGTCGDHLTWHLADGILTISGTGPMWDYTAEKEAPWRSYHNSVYHLVVEKGVTNIGEYAFATLDCLRDVSLSDSVETIKIYAFYQDRALASIHIPGGVKTIMGYAFAQTGLKSVVADKGLKSIYLCAFQHCGNLKELILPDGLESIGYGAFQNCSLARVRLPASLQDIGQAAFQGNSAVRSAGPLGSGCDLEFGWTKSMPKYALYGFTSIRTLTLPEGLESIGDYACIGLSITSLTIPDSVKSIGVNAFSHCKLLRDLKLGRNVETIDNYAFANIAAAGVEFPTSLKSLKGSIFGSSMLGYVVFRGAAPKFDDISFHFLTLNAYYPADDPSWTESKRKDYGGTINWLPMDESTVPVPAESEVIYSGKCGSGDDKVTWTLDNHGLLTISGTGEMYPFYEYTDSGNQLPSWHRLQVNRVVVEEGVTTISRYAFFDLPGLLSVSIPASVTQINYTSFAQCCNLQEFTVDKNNSEYKTRDGVLYSRDGRKLVCYPGGRSGAYEIPEDVRGIEAWAFYGADGVTAVTVPEMVTSIGERAFFECVNLRGVSFGPNLSVLSDYAFAGCTSLETVELPEKLSTIGENVFFFCESLKKLAIPESVTEIKGNAFASSGLESIAFPNDLTVIPYCCMNNCTSLKNVFLPNSVKEIRNSAFGNCFSLTSIQLPSKLKTIGEQCFSSCALKEVSIPASVTSIGVNAFAYCGELREIRFEGSAPTIGTVAFYTVKATAYYPGSDSTWKKSVRQDYGGKITWVPYLEQPAPEIQITGQSTAGAALSWTAVDGADSYELQRRVKGGDWQSLGALTETAYTDAGAQMGVNNNYRLRACAGKAVTDWSDAIEIFFNPFADVSGTKTIEYVAWAYNNNIVKGTAPTSFSPDASCSRVQFIMMLWKMNGSPIVGGENPFEDVSGTKTTNAILWALEKGVINSGKRFDPNGSISRVQIVMILWKLAGSPTVEGANPFTDVTGKKTTQAVLWAYQNGITKGTSETTFAPDRACTRVQLVIFLYKYNGIYKVI